MNSVELPLSEHSTDQTWADVRRIYRRICLLRAAGLEHDATRIENSDLARALARARDAGGSGSEEAAVLAAEAERVTNAAVLAEILAPMLAEQLRSTPGAAVSAPAPVFSPVAATTTPLPARPAPPPPKPRVNSAPSITDLIDGMLAQRAPPAPGATPS